MVIYTYKKNALFFDAEKVMNRAEKGKGKWFKFDDVYEKF